MVRVRVRVGARVGVSVRVRVRLRLRLRVGPEAREDLWCSIALRAAQHRERGALGRHLSMGPARVGVRQAKVA